MAALVFLGAGLVLVVIGVVLVFRPDRTARYRDVLSFQQGSVSSEFGVAVSRINGILLVFIGLVLLWMFFTP